MSLASHSYARIASRFFTGVAGALVIVIGTISTAPAFAVLGEWSTPVNLSEAGGSAGDHRIAVDGSGNVVAVWLRFDADSNRIAQSSWSGDGGASWSAPVNLSEPGEWASDVYIAVDGSGIGHAVWGRYDGNDGRIQYTRSIDGGVSWSVPVNLSTSGGSAERPQIVVDGSGNLVAVWNRSDGSYDIIQSSRSTNSGVSWSTPVNLSLTGQDASNSRVATDGSGNVVAVWNRSDGGNQIIQASRSTNGGVSWSTPADLSESGQSAQRQQVAVDGSGNAVAVWLRNDGDDDIVQSSRLVAGGVSWSVPVDVSPAGVQAATPQIAVDGDGNAVAVWRLVVVGEATIIQSSRLVAGGVSWSAPVQLSTSGLSADNPQVAVDDSGNAVAVWQQTNGTNPIIRFSQSTDGGTSWTVQTDLSEPGQGAIHPVATFDGLGNAAALWRRSDGSNDIIQASRSSAFDDGGSEELADTGPGDPVNDAMLVASAGLALGLLIRFRVRRRGVGSLR